MSKSTPSTTTTTQNVVNPVSNAQAPFLQDVWGNAQSNYNNQTGVPYLQNLQGMAGQIANVANATNPYVLSNANTFSNAALSGSLPQSQLPGGPQIGGLSGIANGAVGTGQGYASGLTGIGNQYMPTVAPYMSGLTNLASQYGGLSGAGYGSYGALNNTGNAAANAGQMTAQSLYGLAPQGMTSGYPSEAQLMANSGMAINSNPAFSSGLMGLASGQYINPSTNPALGGTISAALTPLANQFMTSTAPLTASNFEGAGRYGSGAETNAQGQNQYALGQAMQNAVSGIVNNAYNTGLSTTLNAGQALGGIYNTGMANSTQAAQGAGGLAQSGVGLTGNLIQGGGSALNTGYNTAGNLYGAGASSLNSLAGTGYGGVGTSLTGAANLGLAGLGGMGTQYAAGANAANAGYGTGASALNAGGTLANQGTLDLGTISQNAPALASAPLSELSAAFNAAYAPLQQYAALVGSPIASSYTANGTQTTPYYTNILSSLGAGLSGLGALGGSGGLPALLGSLP